MASKFTELAIDCADPSGLARFWCSVLNYEVQDEDDGIVTIGPPVAPDGQNHLGPVPPTLTFAHVPEAKIVKNRLHLDVSPTDREQDEEVRRLLGLGARTAAPETTPADDTSVACWPSTPVSIFWAAVFAIGSLEGVQGQRPGRFPVRGTRSCGVPGKTATGGKGRWSQDGKRSRQEGAPRWRPTGWSTETRSRWSRRPLPTSTR